jgi:hypothetical protein
MIHKQCCLFTLAYAKIGAPSFCMAMHILNYTLLSYYIWTRKHVRALQRKKETTKHKTLLESKYNKRM